MYVFILQHVDSIFFNGGKDLYLGVVGTVRCLVTPGNCLVLSD